MKNRNFFKSEIKNSGTGNKNRKLMAQCSDRERKGITEIVVIVRREIGSTQLG